VAYDKDGKVASDKTAQARSKKELGDEYDMVRAFEDQERNGMSRLLNLKNGW